MARWLVWFHIISGNKLLSPLVLGCLPPRPQLSQRARAEKEKKKPFAGLLGPVCWFKVGCFLISGPGPAPLPSRGSGLVSALACFFFSFSSRGDIPADLALFVCTSNSWSKHLFLQCSVWEFFVCPSRPATFPLLGTSCTYIKIGRLRRAVVWAVVISRGARYQQRGSSPSTRSAETKAAASASP